MNKDNPLYSVFMKVISKHHRKYNVSDRSKVSGNILAIGNPGSGKTSGNKRMIELRWRLNHKIFCLYDGGSRMDMAYFMFKSKHPFWKKPKIEGNKIIGARSYPTELLYPVTRNIPKKIPKQGIPFTIPVCDLTSEDLEAMVGKGSSTENAINAFNNIKDKITEDTTPEDLLNLMALSVKESSQDGIKMTPYGFKKLKTDIIMPLVNEGLLTSGNVSTKLDFKEMIKNKNISVLVLRHCQEKYWGFLVNYFMKHISNELAGIGTTKKLNRSVSIALNEVPDLLSKDDEKGSSADSISSMIAKILKQSRTFNIFLLMDCQLPQELPVVADTVRSIYVYNSSRGAIEKAMEIIGVSSRTGQITSDDLLIIPHLSSGWYYFFDREEPISIYKQLWTRSRSWLDGEDFYSVYDNYYGKANYQDISKIIKNLKLEKEESKYRWQSFRDRKELKKIKKEIDYSEDTEEKEEIKEIMEDEIEEIKLSNKPSNKKIIKKEEIKELKPKRDYSLLKKLSDFN